MCGVWGGLRLKRGVPEMPGEGAWRSAQHEGLLGCEVQLRILGQI